MKHCTNSQNMMDIGDNKLLMGKLPCKMIVGVVRSEAFHGNFRFDLFYYQHCNAQNIQAMFNGALVPIHSFDVDFTNDTSKNCLFLRGLHSRGHQLTLQPQFQHWHRLCKLWQVWKCSVWLCDITKWSIGNRW